MSTVAPVRRLFVAVSALLPGALAWLLLLAGTAGADTIRVSPGTNLNTAYQRAEPGDEIVLAPGAYGSQTISKDPDKTIGSAKVTFRMTGASMTGFTTRANDVDYVDLNTATLVAYVKAGQNVVLRGFDMDRFDIAGPTSSSSTGDPVRNVTVVGGDFDMKTCEGDNHVVGPASGVRLVDNVFRDDSRSVVTCPPEQYHLDCLHTFNGINGMTIAGNTFVRCAGLGALINGMSNLVVENNFMDARAQWGFALRSGTMANGQLETFTNVTIRHNSADRIDLRGAGDNVLNGTNVVEGNATIEGISCRPGVTYRNNLAQRGSRCGSGDLRRVRSIGFVDPGSGNFHLPLFSPAVDRLTTGPGTDLDGHARPQGGKYDIGADELAQKGALHQRSALLRPILKHVARWLRVSRRGFVTLKLACRPAGVSPAARRCRGTVWLRRAHGGHARSRDAGPPAAQTRRSRRAPLGRVRFSIRSGRVVRVKLRLRRPARRALRRHRIRARLRVVVRARRRAVALASKRVILVRER